VPLTLQLFRGGAGPASFLQVTYLLCGLLMAVNYVPQLWRAWRFPAATVMAQSLSSWSMWTVCRAIAFAYGAFVLHDVVLLVVVGIDIVGRFCIVMLIVRAHTLDFGTMLIDGRRDFAKGL